MGEMMTYKVNQETYARLFKHLLYAPVTAYELAEETGIHVITAQCLMRCLHKHKVVHIYSWEKDTMGRDSTPMYKLGRGKDKPRERLSDAERQRRYRAKKKGLEFQNVLFGGLNNDCNDSGNYLAEHHRGGIGSGVGAGDRT